METPSSNRDNLTSNKELSKSRPEIGNRDRSVLIDISNDSPIVGLARGSLETPISKQETKRCKRISNSGEALLRGQVKNLLQSSTPLFSKDLKTFLNFPAAAFTLGNTTQAFGITKFESLNFVSKYLTEDHSKNSQVVCGIFTEKREETEKNEISRSLFRDFSEKSN